MKLHVERGAAGSAVRVRTRSSLLAPRILRVTPTSARVALVATTALLLAGDEAELDIVVGDGVALEIVEVAATVAYAGRGGACSWSANLSVAEGASLRWPGEPFVVATDARATRTTRADIADGGSLMLRDTLVLGRHGEAGGELVARTDISHAGRPALVEEFRLAADDDAPGIRGGRRVVDAVGRIDDGRYGTIIMCKRVKVVAHALLHRMRIRLKRHTLQYLEDHTHVRVARK